MEKIVITSNLLKDYLESENNIMIKELKVVDVDYKNDDTYYNVKVSFLDSTSFSQLDSFAIALLDLLDFIYNQNK
tara:strand:- start:13681 stop:13905 length:225 start_codon:yes stop_codon:yes gene_type:complete